jgi:8-oxo-dGTP pyrophosphatase MutT (NUDIX family)/Txe/YoeB family toxin of Txe-Axe toxin-antitoxin module
MPKAVSRKQWRLMQAILHGKADPGRTGRGTPPKSIAAKFTKPDDDAPENHGQNRGGHWGEEHHKRAKDKVKQERTEKKKKKSLKKSFEDVYKGHAAAVIVLNSNNQILLGRHSSGGLAFAGGHMDLSDADKSVTALRELKEETGLIGKNPSKIWSGKLNGNECDVFIVESYLGEPKSTKELSNPKWYDVQDIPWDDLRDCCYEPLENFVRTKLGKSLKGLVSLEKLESLQKNIIRQKADAVFEVTHGDALKLVGNGVFRKLSKEVKDMSDEDFKDISIDTYTVHIRKHMNDVYSGRVVDGHKVVYQFTNKSLPELTAALMSVFEWYLPEDEKILDLVDDKSLDDDVIHGGIQTLIENYKKHNIGNIYQEMETIREQMRNGVAVDLQQIEARLMKLFDKLEEAVHSNAEKHNKLSSLAGKEIDELESKIRELQSKIDEMNKKPETITAISSSNRSPSEIHDESYLYLPRPQIEISPTGKIKITFDKEWTDLEKSNFLKDMRAKVMKREKVNG